MRGPRRRGPETEGPHPRRRAAVVVALGVVLLVGTVGVAWQVERQASTLSSRVKTTQELVDANVRTLSQAQRELLRLEVLLVAGAGRGEVEQQIAFVSQRAHESALDYQLLTLGNRSLLETARRNERTWLADGRPAVRRAGRTGAPGDVAAAREVIAELEVSYNFLVSQGEIARRTQAAMANEETRILVAGTERQLLWVVGLMAVALLTLGAGGGALVRLDRARARATSRLESANQELTWYARIVQATSSMLVVTDTHGRVRWSNSRYHEFTGQQESELRGRDVRDLLRDAGHESDRLVTALADGTPAQVDLQLGDHTDDLAWMSVTVSPELDEDGAPRAFVFVLEDATERHEAQALQERARHAAEESARAKSSFLATMSHEIRTPLNAVLGLTDLLLQTELDADQRDYVGTAKQSGEHLLALLNDVLDFSAIEAGGMQYDTTPLSLRALLESTISMFNAETEQRGLNLVLDLDPGLPERVRGDSVRLRQVLVNLVGNAVKFTERGGVSVTSRVLDHRAHACTVEITVTDTGIGVPPWRIPQLFQSFVRGDATSTRRYGGTGLGLAICRGLVEGMGGSIDLDSEEGVGTTVSLRLELAVVPDEVSRRTSTVDALPDFSPLRVLVAEDEPINQLVVTKMLGRLGLRPDVVVNGAEAVAAATATTYDVVLMDVQMPVMDGVRAVQLIRDLDLEHPPHVVALTANALSGDRQRFLDAGMDDYVSKPMTIDALVDALDRATQAAAGARRPQPTS